MKNISRTTINLVSFFGLLLIFSSCKVENFLDREPPSNVTPSGYLRTEADFAAYTITRYNFPTHSGWGIGTFGIDNHTDNQVSSNYSNRWVPGEWRVPQTNGSWNFENIRQINYFLETAVPKWKADEVMGSVSNIDHYIGEGYFLRAYEYFSKVQALGDFPIIKRTLSDAKELLIAESKRRPRNEVARFIISDLDSAITLMQIDPPGGKNRLSKNAALLFKSRVALHEATWLMYHKGTPFVPGGPGWPGEGRVENFSINVDQEIDYFLTEAMTASAQVADAIALTPNNPSAQKIGYNSSQNPYFKMFADENLEKYPEVILWRDYRKEVGVYHYVNHYLNGGEGKSTGGGNTGYTRGLVDNFLMENGLPIYANRSGYKGDDFIEDVKKDRDQRLQLFLKAPGELQFTNKSSPNGNPILIGTPDYSGLEEERNVTGYGVKKGFSYIYEYSESGDVIGSIVFRAAEAYLNYIEASYLKEGVINGKAAEYWRTIRNRAGVNPDFNVTVGATNIVREAQNDLAAYSAGKILSDPVLYNIRRERRLELMAEGMRYFDLKRWRSLDQLKTSPYIVEGFKIWGPMQKWYSNAELIEPSEGGNTATVSSKDESEYLRPYRITLGSGNLVKDGYYWAFAHYLDPIASEHFIITTPGGSGDLGGSAIYQNPGWEKEAGTGATY